VTLGNVHVQEDTSQEVVEPNMRIESVRMYESSDSFGEQLLDVIHRLEPVHFILRSDKVIGERR